MSLMRLRAAVHELHLDEHAWVETLFDEGRELLESGNGVFAYSYRVRGGRGIELGHVAGRQSAPEFWRALSAWGADNQAALARCYSTGAALASFVIESAARAGVAVTDFRAPFEAYGVGDLFTVVGHDRSGFGVFLTAPRAASGLKAFGNRRALERLAAELAAAMRLREQRRRAHVARLSASEELVARRLLEGASDKSIAGELGVSVSTVSTFARRLRKKLGCRPGEEALLLSRARSGVQLRRRVVLFERLSAAECEVASELLVGRSYLEIARRREVSLRTVASQCAAIFRKCGVSGQRELAAVLLGA
ncbi:MAG TPA: LuxR C-terminal-related transcriptional regulator [Polyangiaceae bacterium]|nr:LuxR C-terminal-related transcriptional regulator [Polyangiaceae bacterium]